MTLHMYHLVQVLARELCSVCVHTGRCTQVYYIYTTIVYLFAVQVTCTNSF